MSLWVTSEEKKSLRDLLATVCVAEFQSGALGFANAVTIRLNILKSSTVFLSMTCPSLFII